MNEKIKGKKLEKIWNSREYWKIHGIYIEGKRKNYNNYSDDSSYSGRNNDNRNK